MNSSCAVCGANDPRPKLRKGETQILECGSCGLAFWTPEPDFHAQELYDASYFDDRRVGRGYDRYAALEQSLRLTFARRLSRLPRLGPSARVLDIGAAFGFAVAEALQAGWQAVGVEISVAAARRARVAAGGRVAVADAVATPFATGTFDMVTLWDVLEHLPNPHAAVAEVARVLRPNGRLVLTTGDVGSPVARLSGARWHLYTLPEHLFFYTRKSLHILLTAHGLRVEAEYTDSSVYTLGYLVERLRKSLLGRSTERAPSWPGARLRVPLNLFDIVTLEAVRENRATL